MKKFVLIMSLFSFFNLFTNAQKFNDMINLKKYAKENAELPAPEENEKRVVFIGNSITEGWAGMRPGFFKSNNYVGRGISGQTSPQLLSRFRQDVINLSPVAVVINIGTNDIAENTGTYNEDFTLGNIMSMAELADANGIKVILSSVTPAGEYPWRKEIKGVVEKIRSLNERIEAYAKANGFAYIDYFSSMCDEKGVLKKGYGDDGVHPNADAYQIMEGLAKAVIDNYIRF